MKTSILVGMIVVVISLSFIGGISHATEKVFTMELSSFMPATEPLHLVIVEFCREVEKRTNGRVKINVHPDSTLTLPTRTFDSVEKEIIDIGWGPLGSTPGRFPLLEVMDLPLGLKTGRNGSVLATELVKHFKPKEMAKVKVLWLTASPPAPLQTAKPVRNLGDLKGMKIRTLGPMTIKYAEALGAVPVTISPTDTYDAFSKGIAQGTIMASHSIVGFKIAEFLKYTTYLGRNSYTNMGYFVMNLNRWNSFPHDVQKIIDQTANEYMLKVADLWDQSEGEAAAHMKAMGGTSITLSSQEEEKWAKLLVPLSDSYVKDKSEKGLPAADVLKFCKDWIKKNQK